ncbi:hypothetical protein N7455_009934 [Penicillium solitum]|uniref:uncharacterized protein n=1 Tax=Penicillium solitum TaxID=60172 RepID=UPI00184B02DB|nr:hypothetical protein HAV15_001374 [Penicillium sp. str. \
MASPSCDTYCDPLHVPDGYDWTLTDFNYSQFTPLAYQSSTSTLAQPSRVSTDPLRYTYPVQYPVSSVAPSFAVSSGSPSTCSVENDCAATAPGDQAIGYLGPRHDIACTNFPASASSVPRASQVKATSDSYTKGKRASGRTQGRQRKLE